MRIAELILLNESFLRPDRGLAAEIKCADMRKRVSYEITISIIALPGADR